jgi:hypothetical protein
MDWFIKSIFYKQAMLNGYMPEPKMIIGHNLPFDLGAISNRTVKSRDKKFYGALSIGMCRCFERPEKERRCGGTDTREEFRACGYPPNIRIKKLGLGKHMMKCGTKFDGFNRRGEAKYVDACLEFLDTRTLARALLGPGDASLEHLCKMLGTNTQKREARRMVKRSPRSISIMQKTTYNAHDGIEFRRGKRLTFKEIDALKSSVKIAEDGSLAKRGEMDDRADADVLAWKARIKTWQMLCSFGRFPEIAEISGIGWRSRLCGAAWRP